MTNEWAPVALVLVSHSRELAQGAAQVAGQMAPRVLVVPAGGTDDGGLGTSFDRVDAALREATADGRAAVVLTDLGSAVLTSESVLELADDDLAARVRIADAPFVEGAVAAAVTAHGRADLAAVLASARDAAASFGAAAGASEPAAPVASGTAPDGEVRATAVLRNPLGLHARPAALVVRMLAPYDAAVQVDGVNAASVLDLMKLGAVQGDVLTITAQGPQASDAVARLVSEVEAGFGEV
ncbi:dihydroxyacetone kinase phosphoryl donor subunit DhaM [Cellulomonas iranensis]|uniref:dihydroxyacetone kinase phosphoryl donor subunit DhaM n=1 Tax=Cellulomonas iranensis TaxID=76862 RepID=UPI0013D70BA3|nr:dihydroxyacetone kinase phosphoryl donor subunit DhaM [Cellulomonas iranensis]